MLSIGFLCMSVGIILVLFNTFTMRFVKDQVKSKRQALVGFVFFIAGFVMLVLAIRNMMLE